MLNRIAALAFAAIAFASGCSNVQEENLDDCQLDKPGSKIENFCKGRFTYNPADFSSDENTTIFAAVLEMNTFFNKDLVSLTAVSSEQESCQIKRQNLPGDEIGFYRIKQKDIVLDFDKIKSQTSEQKEFSNLIIHEALHSLGMLHSVSGAMCSSGAGHYLSQVDLDQARELGLID